VQNNHLQNISSGAAIQADSVHGLQPKVAHCHTEWQSTE
jgi:hypothetical protein